MNAMPRGGDRPSAPSRQEEVLRRCRSEALQMKRSRDSSLPRDLSSKRPYLPPACKPLAEASSLPDGLEQHRESAAGDGEVYQPAEMGEVQPARASSARQPRDLNARPARPAAQFLAQRVLLGSKRDAQAAHLDYGQDDVGSSATKDPARGSKARAIHGDCSKCGNESDASPSDCSGYRVSLEADDSTGTAGAISPSPSSSAISSAGQAAAILQGTRDAARAGPTEQVEALSSIGRSQSDGCPANGSVAICGLRQDMEDAVTVVPRLLRVPRTDQWSGPPGMASGWHAAGQDQDEKDWDQLHFFAVYDGHGGSEVSSYCAESLHQTFATDMQRVLSGRSLGAAPSVPGQRLPFEVAIQQAFLSTFLKVDATIGGHCVEPDQCTVCDGLGHEPLASDSTGSTAVVATVTESHITVANCGDSRAVLARAGEAVALSRDQKPDHPAEQARIERSGGWVLNTDGVPRINGMLAMSRAIGDRFLKPHVIAEPEVTCTRRTAQDEFVILASDGLFDVITNEVACEIVRRCLALRKSKMTLKGLAPEDGQGSPAMMAAALLSKLAIARGSGDNISVVVIDLSNPNLVLAR